MELDALETVTQVVKDHQKCKSDLEFWKSENNTKNRLLEGVRDQLNRIDGVVNSSYEAILSDNKAIERLQTLSQAKSQRNAELEQQIKTLEKDIEYSKIRNAGLEKRIQKLEVQNKDLKNATFDQQVSVVEQQKEELESRLLNMVKDNVKLSNKLTEMQENIPILVAQLSQAATLETKANSILLERDALDKKLLRKITENEELRNNLHIRMFQLLAIMPALTDRISQHEKLHSRMTKIVETVESQTK